MLFRSDEAIFLGYSSTSKAFRVFNKRTLIVEESIHVVFDESNDLPSRKNEGVDDADPLIEGMKEITLKDSTTQEDEEQEDKQDERGEKIQERSEEHTSELQSLRRISYAVFCPGGFAPAAAWGLGCECRVVVVVAFDVDAGGCLAAAWRLFHRSGSRWRTCKFRFRAKNLP